MISGRFYTSEELQKLLGVSGSRISDMARQHKWDSFTAGILYHTADVDEYLITRQRTELSKKLGWSGRGLIRDDSRDMQCPECGGFAVEAPATPEEMQSLRWLRAKWNWLCEQGHKGK